MFKIVPTNCLAIRRVSHGFFPSNNKTFSPSIGTDFSLVSEDFFPSLEYVDTHFSPTIGETDTDFFPSILVGKRRRFWEERRRFVSTRDLYLIIFYQKDKKNFCTCSVF